MKAIDFLNTLEKNLPFVETLSRMTSTTVDDWLVALAKKMVSDPDLKAKLASWLSWTPLFGSIPGGESAEPCLPDCCKDIETDLIELRQQIDQ